MRTLVSRMAAASAAAAAAVAARKAVELGWRAWKGEDPPTAGAISGDTELKELVLWAALLAGAVVLARKLATDATEDLLGPA